MFLMLLLCVLKPGWCQDMGSDISYDCKVAKDGTKYNMANFGIIRMNRGIITIFLVLGLITISSVLTAIHSKRKYDFGHAAFLIIVYLEAILIYAFKYLDFVDWHVTVSNTSFTIIIFFISCQNFAKRGLKRLIQIIWLSKNITMLYLFTVLFFTLLFRSISWDSKLAYEESHDYWTKYSWKSFTSTLLSWVITASGDNFPDVAVAV